jgi:glycosyltransferase involved in cell wall biosynthesis
LKIVCIGPAFPLRGGIANFNMALSRSFQGTGHDVQIFSFSLQYPRFLFPGKSQVESGTPPELSITRMINSVNPFSWLRTARSIRKANPEIVVVHHWMPFIAVSLGFILRRVRKVSGIKIISVVHNVVPHEKQPGWRRISRYFFKSCHGFIGMSGSVLEDLGMFVKGKEILFIPHPIYDIFGEKVDKKAASGQLKLDPELSYLLFFGMIRKYKGLDLLLDAMPGITQALPDVRLIVAGEFYSDKDAYLEKIERLGVKDQVIIADEFIPSEQVKYYFSIADMVVQPYITATQSGVTQIAYHFEVPMLVTDVGGLAEIVPDERVGYVVPVDQNAISNKVIDFYKNNRREAFISNLKVEKKRFSWEEMARGIQKLAGL